MGKGRKKASLIVMLIIINILILLLGICIGSVNISFIDVIKGIFNASEKESVNIIINSLRLPRVLGALFAGIALATSGLLLQTVLNNDLCAPNILGINTGAGFFVMLALCIAPVAYYVLPLAAFIGALTSVMVVLGLARISTKSFKTTVILSGVAVGSLFGAGISYLSIKYPDILSIYTSFSVGGFNGVYMKDIIIPMIIITICVVIVIILSPKINLFCLGDNMAKSLGVDVKKVRIIVIIISSLLCASAVSYAGLIGFVGLIVPHISKRIVKGDIKLNLICSCLIGSTLVMFSDLLGRVVFAPGEIPSGIVLSFIGAPFFIFLLLRRRNTYD